MSVRVAVQRMSVEHVDGHWGIGACGHKDSQTGVGVDRQESGYALAAGPAGDPGVLVQTVHDQHKPSPAAYGTLRRALQSFEETGLVIARKTEFIQVLTQLVAHAPQEVGMIGAV